jgi:hypothetical protein
MIKQEETKDDLLRQAGAEEEKLRLTTLLLQESRTMASDYKNTLKHTSSSLLASSMAYAYSKALNDAFKLLTKEQK